MFSCSWFLSDHTHMHLRLTALFPGLPGWAGTRKVKPIRILLKQETVSGSGISWAMCKSAPHSRQIATPAPHLPVFYRPDALPAAQPTASKHCQINYLRVHQTNLRQIFRFVRTIMDVDDQSEISFLIPQGSLPWQPNFLALSTELTFLMQMASGLASCFVIFCSPALRNSMVNQIPLHALMWFLENGNIKSRKPRKFWNIITTEAFCSILAIWITTTTTTTTV